MIIMIEVTIREGFRKKNSQNFPLFGVPGSMTPDFPLENEHRLETLDFA